MFTTRGDNTVQVASYMCLLCSLNFDVIELDLIYKLFCDIGSLHSAVLYGCGGAPKL